MMNPRNAIVWTVVLCAIGAVVWICRIGRTPPAVAVKASDRVEDDVRQLQTRLAQLERASTVNAVLAKAAHEQSVRPELPAPSAVAPAGSTKGAEAANAADERMPDESEFVGQLEDKFQSEQSDPHWSRDAAVQAISALSSGLPAGSKLGAIECRTNLCKVESSHHSIEEFQSFVRATLLNHQTKLWNAQFSAQVLAQSDAGVAAVTFIAREGRQIPEPEPVPN